MEYNKLLQRQINKHLGKVSIPDEYAELFKSISQSYDHHEKEYDLLEHTMDCTESEIMELNSVLKRESALLQKAQNEIKTLFENIDQVYFSVDMEELKIIQMSAACEKVYGYTPDEFKNNINLWFNVVHPDDAHLLTDHNKNLAKGNKLSYQYRIIHRDKSIKWIESKVIPTLDENGVLCRIDGVISDITDRVEAEEKIKLSERLLIESQYLGKMGSWNSDMVTGEIYLSESIRSILGIDKEYKPDLNFFTKILHPDDNDRVIEELNSAMNSRKAIETIYRIIRPADGEERILQTVIRSLDDEQGNIVRVYGVSQDITERRIAEIKMEQLYLSLYQISHDLRGPLNSAKNYIYLALKRVSDKIAINYLEKINDSYSRMEHRVLSLLDLQRINRADTYLEKIDVPHLIKDIVNTLDGLKGFNEIDIKIDIDLMSDLYSDRQFLHSIMHNLISNAIAYRKKTGGAQIRISAKNENENVIIKVSDNGVGIPDKVKEKIFTEFAKGDKSLNGTGLGLYIVKKLVAKLNGDITFKSEAMKGTTFTIKLPSKAVKL